MGEDPDAKAAHYSTMQGQEVDVQIVVDANGATRRERGVLAHVSSDNLGLIREQFYGAVAFWINLSAVESVTPINPNAVQERLDFLRGRLAELQKMQRRQF